MSSLRTAPCECAVADGTRRAVGGSRPASTSDPPWLPAVVACPHGQPGRGRGAVHDPRTAAHTAHRLRAGRVRSRPRRDRAGAPAGPARRQPRRSAAEGARDDLRRPLPRCARGGATRTWSPRTAGSGRLPWPRRSWPRRWPRLSPSGPGSVQGSPSTPRRSRCQPASCSACGSSSARGLCRCPARSGTPERGSPPWPRCRCSGSSPPGSSSRPCPPARRAPCWSSSRRTGSVATAGSACSLPRSTSGPCWGRCCSPE